MSTPEVPSPLLEAARRLATQISLQPATQEAMARLAAAQQIRVDAAVAAQERYMGQRLAEKVAAALAPGQAMREQAMQQLVDGLNRSWGEKLAAATARASRVRFDTADLDRALGEWGTWQQLSEGDRASATAVLETTFEQATSDPSGEAPEEMVSGLEETVREFESSQAGVIPRRMQRVLFVYFCGLLVIVALMQASFTSDTADAVLGKGSELAPYAGLAMLAAGSAWDKYARRPEDNEDQDDGEGSVADRDRSD